MVETSAHVARKTWHEGAFLRYMGDDLWAIGLVRPVVKIHGVKRSWEWLEGLSWGDVMRLLNQEKKGITRTSAQDINAVIKGINAEPS